MTNNKEWVKLAIKYELFCSYRRDIVDPLSMVAGGFESKYRVESNG